MLSVAVAAQVETPGIHHHRGALEAAVLALPLRRGSFLEKVPQGKATQAVLGMEILVDRLLAAVAADTQALALRGLALKGATAETAIFQVLAEQVQGMLAAVPVQA